MKYLVKHLLPALGALVLAQVAVAAGDAAAGADKVAMCSACHGPDGNSPSSAFPKIAGLGEKYLLKQMLDIREWDQAESAQKANVGRPVPQMTGMLRNLSDQDLADIAAFYARQDLELTGAEAIEVQIYTGERVDGLALGEKVYRAGNMETGVPSCMGCHAPDGKGNPPAGFPRLGGQYPEYIAQQLRAFRAGDRTNDGDTMMMRLTARNMSDAEIDAVANYIGGLH